MRNRRLLAVLLIFIFVAGFAVSSALIFRVQEITPRFVNATEILTDEEESAAIASYTETAMGIAGNKNILFGVDRDKIKSEIEKDWRVKVSNIEAKFPNKLEISVRERIPMYMFELGEPADANYRVAIMDYEFQIISDDASIIPRYEQNYEHGLIDLGGSDAEGQSSGSDRFHIDEVAFADFKKGDNFGDYIADAATVHKNSVRTLTTMVQLFLNKDNFDGNVEYNEYQLCYLIQRIDFDFAATPAGTMVMFLESKARDDGIDEDFSSIRIEIRDFSDNLDEKTNFNEKLRVAWFCLMGEQGVSGDFEGRPAYHGTDYQDGTIIVSTTVIAGQNKVVAWFIPDSVGL